MLMHARVKALGAASVLFALAGCGASTAFPNAAPSTPPSTGAGTTKPLIASGPELRVFVPPLSVMGPDWGDDGDVLHSPDVEHPPPTCASYSKAFNPPARPFVHQYAYKPTSYGTESGGASFTVVHAASATVVTRELQTVKSSSFRQCALDTAVAWFKDSLGSMSYSDASARQVALPDSGAAVNWRVQITINPRDSYYLDIAYLGVGSTLVKARIGLCGCQNQEAFEFLVPNEPTQLAYISAALRNSQ